MFWLQESEEYGMKLIICDKNKKVTNAVNKLLSEYGKGIFNEVEVINGDVIKVHESVPGSKIVTASNPQFSPDGGLDAVLASRYGWSDAREFSHNNHLFFIKTVDNNRKSSKDILLRAAVGILGYSRIFIPILTGIGTGVGGVTIEVFIDIVKAILSNLSSADLRSAKKLPHKWHSELNILRFQTGKLKAYKFIDANGKSPLNCSKKLSYEAGKTVTEKDFNADDMQDCGAGINIATLEWCERERQGEPVIEVEFDAKDIVSIPYISDGKFRVKKLKVLKILTEDDIKKLLKKTRSYPVYEN